MTEEHSQDRQTEVEPDDVDDAIATARSEASEHNAEYAAGIRLACTIIEDELDC